MDSLGTGREKFRNRGTGDLSIKGKVNLDYRSSHSVNLDLIDFDSLYSRLAKTKSSLFTGRIHVKNTISLRRHVDLLFIDAINNWQ